MTFTSDERREVAWRLRTEVSEGECIDYAVCRIINDVLGVNGAWGAKAARILADLIDPTCENTKRRTEIYDRSFRCSACGYETWTYDDSGCAPWEFSYCPNCGARVVDDE